MANMLTNLIGGLSSAAGRRVVDDFFGPGATRIMFGWYNKGIENERLTQRIGGLSNTIAQDLKAKTKLYGAVVTMSAQLTRTDTLITTMAGLIENIPVSRQGGKEIPIVQRQEDDSLGNIGGVGSTISDMIKGAVAGVAAEKILRLAAPFLARIVGGALSIPGLALMAGAVMLYLAYEYFTGNLKGVGNDEETYRREKSSGRLTDDRLLEIDRGRRTYGGSIPSWMREDTIRAYKNKGLPVPEDLTAAPRPVPSFPTPDTGSSTPPSPPQVVPQPQSPVVSTPSTDQSAVAPVLFDNQQQVAPQVMKADLAVPSQESAPAPEIRPMVSQEIMGSGEGAGQRISTASTKEGRTGDRMTRMSGDLESAIRDAGSKTRVIMYDNSVPILIPVEEPRERSRYAGKSDTLESSGLLVNLFAMNVKPKSKNERWSPWQV